VGVGVGRVHWVGGPGVVGIVSCGCSVSKVGVAVPLREFSPARGNVAVQPISAVGDQKIVPNRGVRAECLVIGKLDSILPVVVDGVVNDGVQGSRIHENSVAGSPRVRRDNIKQGG